MKIMTVVGARPQFVKAAPLSQAIRRDHTEFLLHTGQHYDDDMSAVFFDELGIPQPDVNLSVGSGSHGKQTAAMLEGIETHLITEKPDWILLYGDTNSTLAGALAAAKLHIPVAHVEAGLRSFNRAMPEEINRLMTDHLSDVLFCPTETAVENLKHEGITKGVHHVGDVMVDALYMARKKATQGSYLDASMPDHFFLATIHRPANTDSRDTLNGILEGFERLDTPIVLPVHPRLKGALEREELSLPANITAIPPASYVKMVALLDNASLVLTDSGGLQKEAYLMQRPCVTVRPETEWVETIECGWNRLTDPTAEDIVEKVQMAQQAKPTSHPDYYGDGHASQQILEILENHG